MTIHRGLIRNKCTLNYHYSIESLIADIFCYKEKFILSVNIFLVYVSYVTYNVSKQHETINMTRTNVKNVHEQRMDDSIDERNSCLIERQKRDIVQIML